MNTVSNLEEIKQLAIEGAIFYVSHSGGKDSQAMYAAIMALVAAGFIRFNQVRVIHADLGDIEHADVFAHICNTTQHNVHVALAYNKAGNAVDLFDMVRGRRASLDAQGKFDAPAFPSSAARFCTSDLKTGPIWREIRQAGHKKVINCVGIRAEESKSRAKKVGDRGTLNLNKKNTNSKRVAYDWWPIADWSIDQVWTEILRAGQSPHPVYKLQVNPLESGKTEFTVLGNERLSCMFCIFGSVNDLRNAAAIRPDLLQKYTQLETDVRGTMFHGQSILERIEINPAK
jgi:3'-phosphoadenosine 5'-phosphosulfate sulfotransferase (PAPS reductase)/FAD synthetase